VEQNNDAYWGSGGLPARQSACGDAAKGSDAQFDAVDRATLLAGQQHNLDVVKLHACIKAQNEEPVKGVAARGRFYRRDCGPRLCSSMEKSWMERFPSTNCARVGSRSDVCSCAIAAHGEESLPPPGGATSPANVRARSNAARSSLTGALHPTLLIDEQSRVRSHAR